MAVRRPRLLKTIIGLGGAILLGTLGSLLANIIWNMSFTEIFETVKKAILDLLFSYVPVWVMLTVVAVVMLIAFIIVKSRRPVNLVVRRKGA
jgi:hypothetical protein